MQLLKVSKRTVYRELANLENSLRTVGASLEKEGRGHFRVIVGNSITQLQEAIMSDPSQKSLRPIERTTRILLQLATTAKPISSHRFLELYQISNTTFFSDIKQLEESLARLPLTIVRNQGYELKGPRKTSTFSSSEYV